MRTSHENRLADRLGDIADDVVQEPRIPYAAPAYVPAHHAFKTPDIRTYKPDALIECTTLMPAYAHTEEGIRHGFHHSCGPEAACSRLYDKLERKMRKYREIAHRERVPYVVALQNLGCASDHHGAMEVLFGSCLACLQAAGDIVPAHGSMWDTPGLFRLPRNSHVSAVLHTSGESEDTLLIPNPNADLPVPQELFNFARVADIPGPVLDHEHIRLPVGA